jgi:tellurite resistance protein
MSDSIARLPASFFGIVLGIAGLGLAWRGATRVWGMPSQISEVLLSCAAIIWLVLLILYVLKWLLHRQAALTEARHPIQCCFISLVGIATMLIALAVAPYSGVAALVLFVAGAAQQLFFGIWRTGTLWQGGRSVGDTTPVMYLPLVGGSFVTATTAAVLGFPEIGGVFLGGGVLSWLAIESVVLSRLYAHDPLPPPLRPTLGIMLAPPAVGGVSYLALTHGPPDLISHVLFGYALLIALVLIRLAKWIHVQPFSAAYWGFSFGVSALPGAGFRMLERGEVGTVAHLMPAVFVLSNLAIAALTLGTVKLLWQHRLLPPPANPAVVSPPSPGTNARA